MSQSTPTQTPSRRRALPIETPGSARSTTSATDRSTLLDRVEELDLEVHDLRRQIAAERQRRRPPSSSSSSSSTSATSLSLRYIDPTRDAERLKQVISEKLREMDDDALTALLTASSVALGRLVAGKQGEEEAGATALVVMDAGLIPSKSVGVEGTGSGSDLDRRLAASSGSLASQLSATRHAHNINSFLKDRSSRLTSLLDSLVKFSHLDIDSLDQTETGSKQSRTIRLSGNFARLFAISVKFDVVEEAATSSPQIQRLQVTIPDWLRETLDGSNRLYSKLLDRNDLPAILMMLRTMVPLLSLRRNLFTSLMESYTDLARDHVRSWESQHGVDFTPFHPTPPSSSTTSAGSSSSSGNAAGTRKPPAKNLDESIARSLIHPQAAQTFTLRNKSSASLTLVFTIRWNRFGHAFPDISATPHVPDSKLDATSRAFLQGFQAEFGHLLRTAIAQNGIVGLADKDDDDDDDEEEQDAMVGRWGVNAAIHATVKAFFRIQDDESAESAESDQE